MFNHLRKHHVDRALYSSQHATQNKIVLRCLNVPRGYLARVDVSVAPRQLKQSRLRVWSLVAREYLTLVL